MKYAILSPDKSGRIDPPVHAILQHFPNLTSSDEADIVLLPITHLSGFEFNPALLSLKKPYVLFDYCEYGANDWDRQETHLFGVNTSLFEIQYIEFDTFVRNNPPLLYFKRELLEKDRTSTILPIEYPCYVQRTPVQSREHFENRPIEVFNSWGYSHESRVLLHGNMFLSKADVGYTLVDNYDHITPILSREKGRIWVSVHTPDFARIPIQRIIGFASISKISVSLPGAGVKCFRHSEVSANSIMFMQEDNLAWAFPWVAGFNCLKSELDHNNFWEIKGGDGYTEIDTLKDVTDPESDYDLYGIYLCGMENADRYRIDRYVPEYLVNHIELAIS